MLHAPGRVDARRPDSSARPVAVGSVRFGQFLAVRWRRGRRGRVVAYHYALFLIVLAFSISGWSAKVSAAAPMCAARFPFGYDEPERQGVDPQRLLELTRWIRENPAPILSLTISRNGKILYELYSSRVDRNAAHYLMSVTKSVTSALVGAAMDRHLVRAADSNGGRESSHGRLSEPGGPQTVPGDNRQGRAWNVGPGRSIVAASENAGSDRPLE
jgi:hypothetical protein